MLSAAAPGEGTGAPAALGEGVANAAGVPVALADAGSLNGTHATGQTRRSERNKHLRTLAVRGRSEVQTRRKKLEKSLEVAMKNADKAGSGDPVEAVVHVVEEFRQQELAFDMNFDAAVNLLHVMGVTHFDLFSELLEKLQPLFAEGMRSSNRESIESALMEVQTYSLCAGSHHFVRIALEHMVEMPLPPDMCKDGAEPGSRIWIKSGAVEQLAESVNSEGESQLDLMPDSLRAHIYERKPELFLKKVQPDIVEFVRDARRNHGNLLMDLKKIAPRERRRANAALQNIKKFVGSQQKLYALVKNYLLDTFCEAPILRLPSGLEAGRGGEDDEQPVSIGPEPFLSTIRSDLLLSLIEDGVLTHSPFSGCWLIEVERCDGRALPNYTVLLSQNGAAITGTSHLTGIKSVEGSSNGTSLTFRQIGEEETFICTCQLSDDKRRLLDGHWSFQSTKRQGGNFTGMRVGPAKYIDSTGCEWDPCAELIVALDSIHQNKFAIDDQMCAELPLIVRDLGAVAEPQGGRCAAEPSNGSTIPRAAGPESLDSAASFALLDPCVIQSICRGMLASFRELDKSSLGSLDARGGFSLLLLLCAARMLSSAGAVRELDQQAAADACLVRPYKVPGFRDLGNGAPPLEDLEAYGLNCAVIAGLMWVHAQQNLEIETEDFIKDALRYAAACCQAEDGSLRGRLPAVVVVRLIVNALVNKCLVVSEASAHQYKFMAESLKVMEAQYAEASRESHCSAESGLDCLQQQAVDMIVCSGLRLREKFHLGIRQPVLDHLIFLAKQDAWAHRQATELLQLYRIPNFASAREEITCLRELSQHGKLVDSIYDWTKSLGRAYNSIVESHPYDKGGPIEPGAKGYLAAVYLNSELGRQYPPDSLHSPQMLPTAPPETVPKTPTEVATPTEAASLPALVLPPAVLEPEAKANDLLPLDLAPRLRADLQAARSEMQLPDAVMAVDVSHRIRDFCVLRSAAAKGVNYDATPSQPSTPTSPVQTPFRRADKAIAADAVAEASQHLVENFQGYHNLARAVAGFVCALVPPKDLPGSAACPESLMRQLTISTLVAAFKYVRAERLCTENRHHKWVHEFSYCREWRTAIYHLMANKLKGHYSNFLTLQLQLVGSDVYQDELLSNMSCVGNISIFHELFKEALWRFFDTLAKAGSRNGYNESVMAPAVQEVCRISRYLEFPWIYAQACLHQLIRMRPRERHLLRFLAKTIAEVPGENLHRVVNRFTSLPLFPQLFNIVVDPVIESQRRRGDEIRIQSETVSVLCGLIEDLIGWKNLQLTAKIETKCSSPKPVPDQRFPVASAEDPTSDNTQQDDATQAASSVGAGEDMEDWQADMRERDSDMEDWRADQSLSSHVDKGGGAKGESEAVQRALELARRDSNTSDQPSKVESMSSASIWHMRAVSSREAGSEVSNAKGPQSHAVQAAAALDAVRRSPILNDLLCQFVNPKVVLQEEEYPCHARLLALLTVDGFLQEAEDLDGRVQNLQAVARTAQAAIVELTRIYKVTHSPLRNWARKVLMLKQLQCSSVASMAGLRWMSQVFLNKKGKLRSILARIAAVGLGTLFAMLRSAYMAHSNQAKAVLGVLYQLLELAAHKKDLDEDEGSPLNSDGEDKEKKFNGNQYVKLCHDIERLTAAELVHLTCGSKAGFPVLEFLHERAGSLDSAVLRHFTTKLLSVVGAPMSERMAWVIARLLVRREVADAVFSADMVKPLRDFLEICRRSTKLPQADALDQLDILKQRSQETQEALKKLEAKLGAISSAGNNTGETLSTGLPAGTSPPSVEASKSSLSETTEYAPLEYANFFDKSKRAVPKHKKKVIAAKKAGKPKAKTKAKASTPSSEVDSQSPYQPSGSESNFSLDSHDSDGEDTFDFAKSAAQREASPGDSKMPPSIAEEATLQAPAAEKSARILTLRRARRARAESGVDCVSPAVTPTSDLASPTSVPVRAAAVAGVAQVLFNQGGVDCHPSANAAEKASQPAAELLASSRGVVSGEAAALPAKRKLSLTVKGASNKSVRMAKFASTASVVSGAPTATLV